MADTSDHNINDVVNVTPEEVELEVRDTPILDPIELPLDDIQNHSPKSPTGGSDNLSLTRERPHEVDHKSMGASPLGTGGA